MAYSKTGLAAVALMAMLAAGCSSTRFSSMDTQPAPLQAAPAGQVATEHAAASGIAGDSQCRRSVEFPRGARRVHRCRLDHARRRSRQLPHPTSPTASVAGVWNASVSGQSCRVATPQTKFGAGYRAGPLRCPAPVDGVKSWNVAGKQLSLYDESGSVVARLYSSGPEKFDGQTSTGLPISLHPIERLPEPFRQMTDASA